MTPPARPGRRRYASAERAALCDLLARTGPAEPTLCEGWNTAELAAHLVVRERRPDAAVGIMVDRWTGHADAVRRSLLGRTDFQDLVRLVRQGPPRWILPPIDEAMNALEFFIHHEDIRRAGRGWEPRDLDPGHEYDLWRRLAGGARFLLRHAPVRVVLTGPAGERVTGARWVGQTVTVTGRAPELVLFAFGRQGHAQVECQGPPDAVAAVRDLRLGI